MLLAIDIGNSSISVGVFDISNREQPIITSNFKITSKDLSADEYTVRISDFLVRNRLQVNAAVISSVVPSITDALSRAALKICGKKPFLITNGIRTGFGIKIKNPEQLGSDIVCNVAAALKLSGSPLAILDMGTATTITVVDTTKTVLGTIIIPGIKISLDALYDCAAQLSDIYLDTEPEIIGKDTKASICSGVINGNALMIDGFIRNIREELNIKESGEKLNLVATGGLCNLILPHLRNKFIFDDTLTLFGMVYLYLTNNN